MMALSAPDDFCTLHGTGQKPRLLIVDDDVDAAEALEEVMTRNGYTVSTAHNVNMALDGARDFHPDIALVDIRLGRESGIDLIGQFRLQHPKLPCILMTAYADLEMAIEAVRHGAHEFLRKPLKMELLEAALERCLRLVRLEWEKEQAESNLTIKEGWLQTALDNMAGGIFMFDEDLKIQVASPSFHEFYEFPVDMVAQGASAVDLMKLRLERGDYGAGDKDTLLAERIAAYRNHRPTVLYDTTPDGRFLELFLSPMPNGGVVGVFNDITERKKHEQQMLQAMGEIVKATQAKSDFLASMSHELRTPLNAILGFSDMICNQYLGPVGNNRYAEYAKFIGSSGQHLLNMVNDILDIERIEAGKYDIKKEQVEVCTVADECFSLLYPRAKQGAVTLVASGIENLSPVHADRRALLQILTNLLTNAVKFTPAGGQVMLKAYVSGTHHKFEVSDTGIGIQEDKISTLTDPFTRHDPDPHKSQDGVGLGLAICSSLVELHNGELTIDSEVGAGTTVTVTLPSTGP